jgi:hypothetical protein
MKKLIVLLIIILGISLVAYAGATKCDLVKHTAAVDDESGWLIVNTNPQKTILVFQVDGLPVGEDIHYYAYYTDGQTIYPLGELKVNKFGSGHLNVSVSVDDAPSFDSFFIGVSNAETIPMNGSTVVLVRWPLP